MRRIVPGWVGREATLHIHHPTPGGHTIPVYIAQYVLPGTPSGHRADPPRAGWVHTDSGCNETRLWLNPEINMGE